MRQLKGHKTWGKQTHSMLGPLSFKLRVLAKQVSQDFMHSFLGLMASGEEPPVPAQGCISIVSGLSQAGGCKAGKRLGDFWQTE